MVCWYLKSVFSSFFWKKSDLGKNPEERSLGERGKFKKVKGKQAESGMMWPFVFPTKLWQRSFWHFSVHSIWVATEIQLSACSIHGEGVHCQIYQHTMHFLLILHFHKSIWWRQQAVGAEPEERCPIQLFCCCCCSSILTDLVVYICSHNRELWPRLTAPSDLASLTRKWHFHTAPPEGMFFRGTEAGFVCLCIPLSCHPAAADLGTVSTLNTHPCDGAVGRTIWALGDPFF